MKPIKPLTGVLVLAVCLATVAALPGGRRETSNSDESGEGKNVDTVLVLPPGSRNQFGNPVMSFPRLGADDDDDDDDLDDDALEGFLTPSFSFNPFRSNPLDGFYTRMQELMRGLREQMTSILSRLPQQGSDVFGPWGKVPEGANTTSTTKIIDGHVVTINETTYSDGDDTHGTVFRVRVIDVKPANETTTTPAEPGIEVDSGEDKNPESTTPPRSVETVEDFSDNEIPKAQGELTA